jgi:hypothetical protein
MLHWLLLPRNRPRRKLSLPIATSQAGVRPHRKHATCCLPSNGCQQAFPLLTVDLQLARHTTIVDNTCFNDRKVYAIVDPCNIQRGKYAGIEYWSLRTLSPWVQISAVGMQWIANWSETGFRMNTENIQPSFPKPLSVLLLTWMCRSRWIARNGNYGSGTGSCVLWLENTPYVNTLYRQPNTWKVLCKYVWISHRNAEVGWKQNLTCK